MDSFAQDVDAGLSASPKHLSSKYFYDDQGIRIFQQIMDMPEYYLTGCEHEILSTQAGAIYEAAQFEGRFDIVELGAGDGAKTQELIGHLLDAGLDFTYLPIDISAGAMNQLTQTLQTRFPKLDIRPQVGDYFKVLEDIVQLDEPKLFLFLGANIGNYLPDAAVSLLRLLHSFMHAQDKLLIGFDLKKNPLTIAAAYNDPAGITRAFNLNLLDRINRELGGDIDRQQFAFYSYYNPINGEVRSFLISLIKQAVRIKATGKTYAFEEGEWIYTELSRKYSLEEIAALAEQSGFRVAHNFCDARRYFTDSLWRTG